MNLNDEITRRVNVLEKVDKKYGVRVWFLYNPKKPYTYLSSLEVYPGIYITHNNDFVYVEECSHDVLYSLPSDILDIVAKNKSTEFNDEFVDGCDEIALTHSNHAEIALRNSDFREVLKHTVAMQINDWFNYLYFVHRHKLIGDISITEEWLEKIYIRRRGIYDVGAFEIEICQVQDLILKEMRFV